MIRHLLRSPRQIMGQTFVLIGAVSGALDVQFSFHAEPAQILPSILNLFALTLSCVAIAWAMFRYGLLDLMPFARDMLVERMSDGVIVADQLGRISDMNQAALNIIGQQRDHWIGKSILQVLPIDRRKLRFSDPIQSRWPTARTANRVTLSCAAR